MTEQARCRFIAREPGDVRKCVAVAGEPGLDEGFAERVEIGEVVVDELAADAGLGRGTRHGDATEPEAVEEPTDRLEELLASILGPQVGPFRDGLHVNIDRVYISRPCRS